MVFVKAIVRIQKLNTKIEKIIFLNQSNNYWNGMLQGKFCQFAELLAHNKHKIANGLILPHNTIHK